MNPLKSVFAWIEDRIGIADTFKKLLAGQVAKHGAWLKTTGMACLVLVLVECITGPVLAVYYSPTPATAYNDILAIESNWVGKFIRGLHHWSSAALIVLALFTVIRLFFTADYRKRRDVVWIMSILFFNFVLFFQLTGHLLPWDTNAVSTADVEAGFAGNLWVVGPLIKKFLLGGAHTGAVTLSRWYGFHVAVLPLLTTMLVAVPLYLNRKNSYRVTEESTSDAIETASSPNDREDYYPFHMAREMLVSVIVFSAVVFLAFTKHAPLELQATAQNMQDYKSLAEWYVLPLHGLTLLPPFNQVVFEPLATFVGPGALITLLIFLPFLDRNKATRLVLRPLAAVCGIATLVLLGGLYGWVYMKERPEATKQEERIALLKGEKLPDVNAQLVSVGKKVYDTNGCAGCHVIHGVGGKAGPDISKTGLSHPEREWQLEHLRKPASKTPGSTMPGYDYLKPDELKALTEYMISLVK